MFRSESDDCGRDCVGTNDRSAGRRQSIVVGARRGLVVVLLLLTASLLPACDIDTDFADDLVEKTAERNRRALLEQQRAELPLPDPESVPYLAVSAADVELDPEFRVELIDDLVLGAGRDEPEYLFVNFSGRASALGNVAIDDRGRIFVLETRDDQVRVFDGDGEFLSRFGQPGQGPGDFERPYGIEVAGDRVFVYHRRFDVSVWDTEGNFIRDRQTLRTPEALAAEQFLDAGEGTNATSREESRRRSTAGAIRQPLEVDGQPDGTMLIAFHEEPAEQTGRITTRFLRAIARFEEGSEVERILAVPEWALPEFAVAPDGGLYVGMFGHLRTEYYVVALDAEMNPRWVLTIGRDPEVPPRAYLRVDAEGRLYVFPNFLAEPEDPRSPVQVYGSDGALIGSGYANRRPIYLHWQRTTPQGIYGVRVDPESEEWQVVRYGIRLSRR